MKTISDYKQTKSLLRQKRSTFYDHWQDLAEQVLPRHARFQREDRNRSGTKRNSKILNGTPTRALRRLASGLSASITSPIRIWFRMGVANQDLMKVGRVQSHLRVVETRMRAAMSFSNFYNGMGNLYLDLALYGTAAMFVDEDDETVIRCYPLMMGSYYLESSDRLQIDTVYREVSMTVKQMIKKFGLSNCSRHVQDLAKQGKIYEWIDVLHIVEPNDDYQNGMLDNSGKPFISVWMEERNSDDKQFLHVGGYYEFPVIPPRWDVTAEDSYGSSPGMDALGDCRMLQRMERNKLRNYDKATDPALVGPTTLRNQRTSLMPGDMTYSDNVKDNSVRPIQDPGDSARAVEIGERTIRSVEQRIEEFYYNDIWLMMQRGENDGVQPDTARGVDEKHEEKMLQLGPMLSRFDDEALNPVVKRIYFSMYRRGMFPPLPEELRGQQFSIRYMNIMAQAQKLLETTAVERLAGFTSGLTSTHPEAGDLIDVDEMVREYADMVGVNPDILLSSEQVKAIRAQKAQAAQRQQVAAGARQGSETAKNLAQVPMNEDNGLTRMMQLYSQGMTPTVPGVQ